MPEARPFPRPAFWIASLLSLGWVGYCIWAFTNAENANMTPTANAVLFSPWAMAVTLAPVAAIYAFAAAIGPGRPQPLLPTPDSLEESESRLAGLAARIESLRHSLADELETLTHLSLSLDSRSQATQQLIDQLQQAGQSADAAQQALHATLPEASQTIATLIDGFANAATSASAEADRLQAAARGIGSEVDALGRQGAATATALAEARGQADAGMRAIRSEADSLFDILENTLAAKRQTLIDSSKSLTANLSGSYAQFESLTSQSLSELSQQVTALADTANSIELRLNAAATTATTLTEHSAQALQQLDAGIEASQQASRAFLDDLSAQVSAATAQFAGFTTPIDASRQSMESLTAALHGLQESAQQVEHSLATRLPAQASKAEAALADLNHHTQNVVQSIVETEQSVASLLEPIDHSRASLDAAAAAYAAQKQAIEAAGAALVVELQQAKLLIAEIENLTRDTSLAAASGLVETFTRVRDIATQATGTMRETLDGLIGEARISLQQAADDALRHSFVEPIAGYAEEAETHARNAAARTASSMAALAEALKLIESRTRNSHSQLLAAEQEDLVQSSAYLMDELSEAAVSIAAALGQPMRDSDWRQWRKGERGLFSRRAHGLIDRRSRSEIASLLQENDRFAHAARNYCAAFETLAGRFEESVPSLTAALHGSEQGRLAAILAEVMDTHQV